MFFLLVIDLFCSLRSLHCESWMHLAGDAMPCRTNHPQDCKIARLPEEFWMQSCGWLVLQGMPSPARCIQDSSGNLAILQSCGRLVLQGIASPARCIQDSPGNLTILQSCGWSVPQCKLRKLAFLMMMKEQSCKLFGRCVWFPVISGGQPPPSLLRSGGRGVDPRFRQKT